MPGNENNVVVFLFQNIYRASLPGLGLIRSVSIPGVGNIRDIKDCLKLTPDNSAKKADILINDVGVSIKQKGGSFLYNRLQRAGLRNVFSLLHYINIEQKLIVIDKEVADFHNSQLDRRDRLWSTFFLESEFKDLLHYLMMVGSGTTGPSRFPAQFILEAPKSGISFNDLNFYTFDEYFEKYKSDIFVSIRRGWVGQKSESEHTRALGLIKKKENFPWVFSTVTGTPRSGWRESVPVTEWKTVYYLMIEKKSPSKQRRAIQIKLY